MRHQMQNPLTGQPLTRQLTDEAGRLAFRVTPRELTPFGARLADGTAALAGLALGAASFTMLIDWRSPDLLHMAAACGAVALGYQLVRWTAWAAFRVTTVIEMELETIRVRRPLGWKTLDRRIDHRFALLVHDDAEAERRCNDLETREAAAKGMVVQKPVYYGDSFHVVLVYAGHRIDLLTVFGRKQAASIVARLQYCDRLLDEEAKRGCGSTSAHAETDWPDAPGGL